jgi:hypothetical protein
MEKLYAMIDIHTGFFWGAAEGESAADACRHLDSLVAKHLEDACYSEVGRYEVLDTVYDVYDASDDVDRLEKIDGLDGRDESLIAFVEALPFVSRVRRLELGE